MRFVGAIDIATLRENVRLEAKKSTQQAEDFDLRAKYGMESANAINPNMAGLMAGLSSGASAYSGGLFDSIIP